MKEREKCYMKENFYTLTSYIHNTSFITYAMEDYIEMIYRQLKNKEKITITTLSNLLHIKKPSCSKMISKLKDLKLVKIENNEVKLTKKGLEIGNYLYYRHKTLETFLKIINKNDFKLDQVEKIEHFIDNTTLKNIEILNKKL